VRTLSTFTVDELLSHLADDTTAPASSTAAAITAALAAALVSMAARRSPGWDAAPGVAAQALVRRARLLARADSGADALASAVRALDANTQLEQPLRKTVEELLAIADGAADVAELAAETALRGEGSVRADAVTAALLAEAAAAAALALVRTNLTVTGGDERLAHAEAAAASAAAAARRAREVE
jgi:formiminotetrahydrofolate cyclodeaminase